LPARPIDADHSAWIQDALHEHRDADGMVDRAEAPSSVNAVASVEAAYEVAIRPAPLAGAVSPWSGNVICPAQRNALRPSLCTVAVGSNIPYFTYRGLPILSFCAHSYYQLTVECYHVLANRQAHRRRERD